MAALDAGKLGRVPGAETGSRGGGRRLVCKAHGREESQQRRKRAENWRTTRLGASSLWRVERPSSVCVQGDGAAWRDRDASGEARDGEAVRARRVAGSLGSARRQTGEGERTERVEREREF